MIVATSWSVKTSKWHFKSWGLKRRGFQVQRHTTPRLESPSWQTTDYMDESDRAGHQTHCCCRMGYRWRPVNVEGATTHSRLRTAVSEWVSECWAGEIFARSYTPFLSHLPSHPSLFPPYSTFIPSPFQSFPFPRPFGHSQPCTHCSLKQSQSVGQSINQSITVKLLIEAGGLISNYRDNGWLHFLI